MRRDDRHFLGTGRLASANRREPEAMVNEAELVTSLLLSVTTLVISAVLGVSVWWERRTRKPSLLPEDHRHFQIQDIRRGVGVICLALLAPGIYIGSRLPIFEFEPLPAGIHAPAPPVQHPNRVFLGVWAAVFALVAVLLALALVDWIATRRYARRQRAAMTMERLDILREGFLHTDASPDDLLNGTA
jgi:hypothetical protein